jgi:hypothetical protein
MTTLQNHFSNHRPSSVRVGPCGSKSRTHLGGAAQRITSASPHRPAHNTKHTQATTQELLPRKRCDQMDASFETSDVSAAAALVARGGTAPLALRRWHCAAGTAPLSRSRSHSHNRIRFRIRSPHPLCRACASLTSLSRTPTSRRAMARRS